jgi:acyl-coenzyme A thioesterase PaaI-like protein
VQADDDVEARARAGRAIRDIGHAVIGHHAEPALIEEVASTIDAMTARVAEGDPRQRVHTPYEDRWQPVADGGRMHTYDDRPFSGRSSPWGLDLSVHRHGEEIEAVLTLRSAHEGAPERSHGGIVAALFDDVFGYVLHVINEPAFTGELTVRYERPTPLHRPIACRGRLASRDGRKLFIEGELVDLETEGRPVVARGRGLFITVDPSVFEVGTQQLPAPPDEG